MYAMINRNIYILPQINKNKHVKVYFILKPIERESDMTIEGKCLINICVEDRVQFKHTFY